MILKNLHRLLSSPAFWLCGSLILAGIASNLTANENGESARADSKTIEKGVVLREGTRIESIPTVCHASGDRLAIQMEEDDRTIVALENLAAQRILKAVLDDPNDKKWIVTGAVTEFQDRNYILLERVTRVSKN